VEQILGRVLRLPNATPKAKAELNCAYAFVTSDRFMAAANTLKEALIASGFEKMDANQLVGTFTDPQLPLGTGRLFTGQGETVTQAPEMELLSPALQEKLVYDPVARTISLVGAVDAAEAEEIEAAFPKPEDKKAVRILYQTRKARVTPQPLEESREPFVIPGLAIRRGEQVQMFDEEPLLEVPIDLAECSDEIPEDCYPGNLPRASDGARIDVTEEGKIDIDFEDEVHAHMENLWREDDWSVVSLSVWLDRHIKHVDLGKPQFDLFVHRVLTFLTENRKWEIGALGRQRYKLATGVQRYVDRLRQTHRNGVYQKFLLGTEMECLEVTPAKVFTLTDAQYAPSTCHHGIQFNRHAFLRVGGMNDLEVECARFLDIHKMVKRWVRNVDRRQESFWLQPPGDKFYPDFLALLNDGRYLVVETKGEHLFSNDRSKQERMVGDLWEERSRGNCLFVMPKNDDWAAIETKMRAN
jgi:type III restriction enzyme